MENDYVSKALSVETWLLAKTFTQKTDGRCGRRRALCAGTKTHHSTTGVLLSLRVSFLWYRASSCRRIWLWVYKRRKRDVVGGCHYFYTVVFPSLKTQSETRQGVVVQIIIWDCCLCSVVFKLVIGARTLTWKVVVEEWGQQTRSEGKPNFRTMSERFGGLLRRYTCKTAPPHFEPILSLDLPLEIDLRLKV